MTAAPAPPLPARTRPATPAQLDWLAAELPLWRAAGLVDDRAATAILANYHPSRRFDLSRLLLTLGAAFVGVGILWLVASNLDQLPPLAGSAWSPPSGWPSSWAASCSPAAASTRHRGRHPLAGRRLRPDPRRSHVRGRRHAGGPEPAGAGVRAARCSPGGVSAPSSTRTSSAAPALSWSACSASRRGWSGRPRGTRRAPLTVLLVVFAGGAIAAAAAAWHEDLLPALRRSLA